MCIPIRGKGGEKEKGSKLWQSLRKCCHYSPNDNLKKTRNKPQTTNHQTSNNSNTKPNTEKQKAKNCLQLELSCVQDDADTIAGIALAKNHTEK